MRGFKKAKEIKSIDFMQAVISTEDYCHDFVEIERFLECCKSCPNYENRWACPPFGFDVKERYWDRYKYIHLFAFRMNINDDIVGDEPPETIDELVMDIRKQNGRCVSKWVLGVEKLNPGTSALDGGHCIRCKKCAKTKCKPCCHEDTMRPAIDAIGGNLVKTAEEVFNTKILWIENGKVPEYFLFIVGLLSNSEEVLLEE